MRMDGSLRRVFLTARARTESGGSRAGGSLFLHSYAIRKLRGRFTRTWPKTLNQRLQTVQDGHWKSQWRTISDWDDASEMPLACL